jgi:hypothetical protein
MEEEEEEEEEMGEGEGGRSLDHKLNIIDDITNAFH